MVGKDIDPSEIGKHPNIIKAAQLEMTQSDVLVCGKCHSVFHFIDLFIEHKENDEYCSKESNLKDCRDTKPKVWAFLLWKSAQINNAALRNKEVGHQNSWQLYQTWVKMDESVRETWVVAGKTIQSFNRMGQGTLQEMPVKITKTVIDTPQPNRRLVANRTTPLKKEDYLTKSKEDVTTDDEDFSLPEPKKQQPISRTPISTPATTQQKPLAATPIVAKPTAMTRRAKRTNPKSGTIEFANVEKIVAKRFNPRRKMHEYLVKWDGYPHEQNTWEPQSHLDTCPQLLDTFEKQLARQKEQRAALERARQLQQEQQLQEQQLKLQKEKQEQAKAIVTINTSATTLTTLTSTMSSTPTLKTEITTPISAKEKTIPISSITSTASPLSPQIGRVTRSSLKKDGDKSLESTLDSLMDTTDSSTGGVKRKLDDSDFNANTTGEEEDFEEDAIPVHAVKRLKNGTTVTTSSSKLVEPKSENKLSPVATLKTVSKSPTSANNSAEIVITRDSNSGIVRRSGTNSTSNSPSQKGEASVRILSRGENTSSGIVRLTGSTPNLSTVNRSQQQQQQQKIITKSSSVASVNQQPARITQITQRTGSASAISNVGQRTPVQRITPQQPTRTPISTQQQRTHIVRPQTTTQQVRQIQTPQTKQTFGQQRSSLSPNAPQSGRMILNRNTRPTPQPKSNITPEEKIIQLSKSGDLKVTRRTVPAPSMQSQTKTNLIQNRTVGPPRTQLQQQQHQRQQALMSGKPKLQAMASKIPAKSPSPSPTGGLTLCPITGKILTESGEEVPPPAATPEKKDDLSPTGSDVIPTQMQFTQQDVNQLTAEGLLGDGQQMLDDGTPLLVTGEDGTIYQVAGKNAEGQTILIAQGADGEQQYAYVANEDNQTENSGGGVLTLDNAVAEAVAHMLPEQGESSLTATSGGGDDDTPQYVIKQDDGTVVAATAAQVAETEAAVAAAASGIDTNQALSIQTGTDSDSQDANIPAEVVQADLPSPGGTRRVILLLQDGTFMMTEMHDDEYQALNIT